MTFKFQKSSQEFIYNGLRAEFIELKSMKFNSFVEFMQFVSRSKKLSAYAAKLKSDFSVSKVAPGFITEVIKDVKVINEFNESYKSISDLERERAEASKVASNAYQKTMKEISDKYDRGVAPHLVNKLVKIACIQVDNLPLSSIVKAQDDLNKMNNPSDAVVRDKYKEILYNYKKTLVEKYSSGTLEDSDFPE